MITSVVVTLLLALLPWWEGGASPGGLFLTQTVAFSAVLIVAVRIIRARRVVVSLGWEATPAIGLLVLTVVSAGCCGYLYGAFLTSWDRLVAALLAAALVLDASLDPGKAQGPQLPWAWVGALATAGVAQSVLVLTMPAPENLTPSGTFANASQLAAWLNLALLVSAGALAECWRAGSRHRVVSLLLAAGILVDAAALFRTGSRAALGSLVVVAAFWGLRASRNRGPRLRRAVWLLLAAFALAAVAAVGARFDRIADPYRYERVRIWEAGLRAMADHPILGLGPGMFERHGYPYNFPLDGEAFRFSKTPGSTHSSLVQAGAEMGIGGLVLAALLMILLGWRACREAGSSGRRAGAAMGLLACLLHGIVDRPFAVPAITLSLVALSIPWILPRGLRESPLAAAFSWGATMRNRMASGFVLAGLLYLYVGAVVLPYAAHTAYLRGELDSAALLGPENPLYREARAAAVWRSDRPASLQDFAIAERELMAARDLNAKDPATLISLARLHARACFALSAEAATAARAERYYREAIALGRKDPRPHAELASFLLALGQPDSAIAILEEAIALEPRFLGAHAILSRALAEAGRLDDARHWSERLKEEQAQLQGYVAKNAYEADLMKLDARP